MAWGLYGPPCPEAGIILRESAVFEESDAPTQPDAPSAQRAVVTEACGADDHARLLFAISRDIKTTPARSCFVLVDLTRGDGHREGSGGGANKNPATHRCRIVVDATGGQRNRSRIPWGDIQALCRGNMHAWSDRRPHLGRAWGAMRTPPPPPKILASFP